MSDEQGLWYEISLTNRQVLAAFLILLACIVGAFVSGVWVGRETQAAEGPLQVATGDLPEGADSFPFYGDEAENSAEAEAAEPPAGNDQATSSPPSEPTRNQEPVVRRPEREQPEPEVAQSDLPAAPRLSADDLIIQVFSSAEESQARSVLQRLVDSRFDAFLSPVAVDGRTMYRVRVGPFENRRQAERVANRVKREQRLDTWITAAGN